MNKSNHFRILTENRSRGFTLIELLVVISIIAILASMVIGLSSVASRKMVDSRVRTDLNQLINAIDTYKAQIGFYPADNPAGPKTNALYYELVGTVFSAAGNPPRAQFQPMDSGLAIDPIALRSTFGVNGISNSSRDRKEVPYTGMHFKDNEVGTLNLAQEVRILIVPAKGPEMITGKGNAQLNPWYYDASSTNRHNRQSYDLWAQVLSGKNTNIIGNWKQ